MCLRFLKMEQDLINKKVKRIDRLVSYIVHHAWIKTAVFIVAFLEATITPILPEIVVAGILTYRKDISWRILSVVSACGSTLGVSVVYLAGKYLYRSYQTIFDNIFSGTSIASYTEQVINQNTFVTMFLAAFTPLPDRIFAFLSGVFYLSFIIVIVAFFCGRLLRVGIVAYFSYHFGDKAKYYILKHTKNFTVVILVICLLYVFLRIKGII